MVSGKVILGTTLLSLTIFMVLSSVDSSAEDLSAGGYKEHLKRGAKYLEQQKYKKSVRELREAISLASQSKEEAHILAYAYNLLGISLVGKSRELPINFTEAEEVFLKVLDLTNGKANVARFNLAELYYKQGRIEESVVLLQKFSREETAERWLNMEMLSPSHQTIDELTRGWLDIDHKTPLEGHETIKPPSKIVAHQPQYTEEALAAGLQGTVIVQVVITETGEVEVIKELKGLPKGLSRSVTKAISAWRFEPALSDGKPIPVYFNVTVNFALNQGRSGSGK
ncbi:MAG: TonB family protein [bacterium]|nr:TonB family protein [bacterium]